MVRLKLRKVVGDLIILCIFVDSKILYQQNPFSESHGRPTTGVTPGIERVRNPIENDWNDWNHLWGDSGYLGCQATLNQLHATRFCINVLACGNLLFVGAQLFDHRRKWVMFLYIFEKFAEGSLDVLTGNETWIYNLDPEAKLQSAMCAFSNDPATHTETQKQNTEVSLGA